MRNNKIIITHKFTDDSWKSKKYYFISNSSFIYPIRGDEIEKLDATFMPFWEKSNKDPVLVMEITKVFELRAPQKQSEKSDQILARNRAKRKWESAKNYHERITTPKTDC